MNSENLEFLKARATRHVEAGDWNSAKADWLSVLAIAPDSADVMLELSYVDSLSGNYRTAREWALRAARARPSSGDAVLALLRRLCTFNEIVVLRALAIRLLADQRTPSIVLAECATQLSISNDFGLAMQCAEVAVAKAPDDLRARLIHGQLSAHHGRIDVAAADFGWALARNPRIATAWWMLARLTKQTQQSNHVAQLRALLEVPGLQLPEVAAVARALHKELDDVGDHEGAWQALQLMCKAMRSFLRYDPMEIHRLVDALTTWSPEGSGRTASGLAGRIPVFIVGMHRSGTTLLEQLLAASPQVKALGELYDFTAALRYAANYHCKLPIDLALIEHMRNADFAELGRRYLDGVAWRLGKESHFTDKQPTNFFNVGFICHALPQAKILHMVRDPMETCFSNLRELFSDAHGHSYDQLELADYFLQYRRLMTHWHAVFPGRILDVEYARLTSEPEGTMRAVADFCGVGYVDGMCSTMSSARAVATASSIQIRGEVVQHGAPKWAPYASCLGLMSQALQDGHEAPKGRTSAL